MKVQCWQVQEVAAAEACVLTPPAPTTSAPRPPVSPSAPEAITSCSTVAHCPDCFHSSAATRLCVFTASSNGPMYSWERKVTWDTGWAGSTSTSGSCQHYWMDVTTCGVTAHGTDGREALLPLLYTSAKLPLNPHDCFLLPLYFY